jgi:hypothetical protein
MSFHLPKLIVPLLVIAMRAMILSAGAQPAGQSIIFSAPQNDAAKSVTPSLAPPSLPLPSLPSTLQAPVSPFSYSPPVNFQELPSPSANASEQERMKKSLSPKASEAMDQKTGQTQLARYLDRENQPLAGRTNGWQNGRANSPWDFAHGQDQADLAGYGRNDAKVATQNSNRSFNGQRNGSAAANQNGNVVWDSFSTPAPVKPNPGQLAAMERFRQLLEPSPAPAAPPSPFFPTPKLVVNPNLTPPPPALAGNPAGASFTPLSSGIGKPAGLKPLPGITTPGPQPFATPAWAPQPPPWVSQKPQPFAMPQWKF